jgi:hypothetical protein
MSKRDADALSDAVEEMIGINKASVSIAPDHIARGALDIIGFAYATHNAGWYGCYQHLLQLTRERLRGKFDPKARAQAFLDGQLEIFGDTLQDRYPRKRVRDAWTGAWSEPEYVLRDRLSEEDRWANIDRLDQVARGSTKHSEALRAETIGLYGPRKGERRDA